MTEVGRQPWIVYEVMRTEDAVTRPSGVWVTFGVVVAPLRRAGDGDRAGAAGDGAALARRRRTTRSTCPTGRAPRADGPVRGTDLSTADAVAGVLWVGVTLYAVFGGRRLRRGLLGADRRQRASAAERPRDADRLGDRPGLGGQPRVADLRARDALDGVPDGVRVGHVHAVHPAQPGRARDRAAGRRVSPSTAWRGTAAGRPSRSRLRRLVGAHAVLHGDRGRRRRLGAGADRQRRRGPRDELAQPGLARDRARCSWPRAPTSPPCSWSATRAASATPTSSATSRRRALGAAAVAGALAVAGIFVLRADARYIYDGLTSEGLPLVILLSCALRPGGARAAVARRAARRAPARGRAPWWR